MDVVQIIVLLDPCSEKFGPYICSAFGKGIYLFIHIICVEVWHLNQ